MEKRGALFEPGAFNVALRSKELLNFLRQILQSRRLLLRQHILGSFHLSIAHLAIVFLSLLLGNVDVHGIASFL